MKHNIWYRSTAAVNVPAWEDRGSLSIERGRFRFRGKTRSVSGTILSVGRTQMGTNKWVYVRYEDEGRPGDAYFMDGGLLGWVGVLGGNKRLAVEFETARSPGHA